MKLNKYLTDNNISKAKFARQIGLDPSTLSKCLTGERAWNDLTVAMMVIIKTGGKVTLKDLNKDLDEVITNYNKLIEEIINNGSK